MTQIIRHRGPDDEGHVLFKEFGGAPFICYGGDTASEALSADIAYSPNVSVDDSAQHGVKVALGHRRLSILDLSPLGHQPMCTQDSRYWIVFNGEVYNYIELRAELENLGHSFISRTDTEVILAAYSQWGDDCLSRFNGMWAFAIYDSQTRKMFLARDRFGVKPLYYWVSPDRLFAFGSEIKQFTVLPGWQAKLNGQRGYDFLVFGITDHTEETMFSGVYQIKPGHCALLSVEDPGSLAPGKPIACRRWYELRPAEFDGSLDGAAAFFRDLFEDSIALRLRADVQIGSCLSGGLDSSSIVCVMNRLLRQKGAHGQQRTFSACSDVARFDERKWIDIVVRHTGVKASFVYPSLERLFEESPAITWHQDEPYGSTSIYAQWNVFRLAAQSGVKVMLDGQGADEQLCGYHGFFGPHLATLVKNLRWGDLVSEVAALQRLHAYSIITSIKFMMPYLLPNTITQRLKRLGGYAHTRPAWLNHERLRAKPVDPFWKSGAREGSIQALSKSQVTSSNLQMLLHWEDRDSMAHSVESRVPFLDYRLVEFVLGLPDKFKIHGGETKRILRLAMRGVLPEAICSRVDKLGFVTPEEVWVRECLPETFKKKIEQTLDLAGTYLEADVVRMEFEQICKGEKRFSFWPWRIVNFGEWLKIFGVQAM